MRRLRQGRPRAHPFLVDLGKQIGQKAVLLPSGDLNVQ
jgi:hypothetical protein